MSRAIDKVEDLAGRLLQIVKEKLTGTLQVTGGDDLRKQVFFDNGAVADLDTGRDDTVLEAALLDTGAYSDRDIKGARKKAQKSDATVGVALLELGLLPDESIEESIHRRLTDEICEFFLWPVVSLEFYEHRSDERLEAFYSDLADIYEVLLDPEEVLIELCRRLTRWDIIQKNFPLLKDVFYATPASFGYFRHQDQFPAEYAIVSVVDGIKDVEEIIEESGLDPFQALALIRHLKANGELELINPVQMFQLGVDAAGTGKFEKARKLFERAYERGLDDFDLQLKLAQALDALGRRGEAIQRYLEFSEKCLSQLRFDDAIRSLKRVTTLDPSHLEANEKYLDLLLDQRRQGEAVDQVLILAEQLRGRGETRKALDLLVRVRTLEPKDVRLQQKIIEFAEACQDQQTARAERELLARNSDERKDVETALQMYQRMFCEGNDSLEVRLKLVELHKAKGNRQKALEHINSVLNLPEKRRPKDESVHVGLHETVRELNPCDVRSNRWLSDHYSRKGEDDKAAAVLTLWIANLEREGDVYEVVNAYERLIAIEDTHRHRWGLAQALEKLGREADAVRELRNLARLAIRDKAFDQATRAVDRILKTAPLDIEAKKLQGEVLEARGEADAAAAKTEEIALLNIVCGDVQEAELYCRRLDASRPGVPEIIRKLGLLCLEQGDRQKAAEQLLKAAKLHLAKRNLGLARNALDRILALEPGHPEATVVQGELKSKEAVLLGTAPTIPATPAATSHSVPPLGGPAASPALQQPTGGIFDPSPTIRTTVSSITSRLRKLKTVGPARSQETPGAPAEPGTTTPSASSPSSPSPSTAPTSLAAGAREGAGASAAASQAGGKILAASSGLKSAASRLKALADRKALEAGMRARHDEESAETPPGTPAEALSGTPPSAAGHDRAAPQGGPPPGGSPSGRDGAEAGSPDSGTAVKRMKLGTSASKLAALRRQAPAPVAEA